MKTKKEAIKKMTELKHFKIVLELRIICNASKEGLGAVLKQKSQKGWETPHFASRFLTEFEKKNLINELKLLAVVWPINIFLTLCLRA